MSEHLRIRRAQALHVATAQVAMLLVSIFHRLDRLAATTRPRPPQGKAAL
jgi:hypothetical protein